MPSVRRYALAAAACELIPVPLFDTYCQNQIRRAALSHVAETTGQDLEPGRLHELADEEIGGAATVAKRLAIWPIKKLLSTDFFAAAIFQMSRVYTDVQRRAVALADAGEPAPQAS